MNKEELPEYQPRLFPRIEAAGRFIARMLHVLPINAPAFMSSHYRKPEAPPPVEPPFLPRMYVDPRLSPDEAFVDMEDSA